MPSPVKVASQLILVVPDLAANGMVRLVVGAVAATAVEAVLVVSLLLELPPPQAVKNKAPATASPVFNEVVWFMRPPFRLINVNIGLWFYLANVVPDDFLFFITYLSFYQ